jgi:hypothetical protein
MARSLRGCGAVLGVLIAFLLAISPGVASAFTKAIWGGAYRNGVNQFPIYKQLGVSILEQSLNWADVAPTRPTHATNPRDPAYQWPVGIRQAIDLGRRYHIRVLLQIIGAPPWANGGRPWNWVPNRTSDFAAFATAAARKYPDVKLWMIWGEPDRAPNFQPLYPASAFANTLSRRQQIAPHNYATLLDAAYGALKHVSRTNIVIGGSTYTTGDIRTREWIQNLKLPNGRPPRMDMYAHNPFSTEDPNFSDPPSPYGVVQFSDLPRLGSWIDKYLHRGLPIFLSEWTVPTQPDTEFNFYVDMPVAVRWVRDALRLSRRWKRIYALGWIHLYDEPPTSYAGLMTVDGKRKPLYGAFAH